MNKTPQIMIISRPKILKKGSNPNCIHYERIIGFVGTCKYCGQVRDYSECRVDFDTDLVNSLLAREKARRGQEVLRQRQAERKA